jgi:hypothetical protein
MPTILRTSPGTVTYATTIPRLGAGANWPATVAGLQSAIAELKAAVVTGTLIRGKFYNQLRLIYNSYIQHTHLYPDLRGVDTFGNLPVYGGGTYAAPNPKATVGLAGSGVPAAPTYTPFVALLTPSPITSYTINAVTTGLNGTWKITGNHANEFVQRQEITIVNNVGLGAGSFVYLVQTATNNGANTDIVITGTIPGGATGNGNLQRGSGSPSHLDFNNLNDAITALRTHVHQINDVTS